MDLLRAGQNDWSKITRLDTPLCEGDRLRTGVLSRAALFIQPETLVRVDQNTSISVSQTAEETLVEFTQEEVLPAAAGAYSCGAGYFITRFPRKFKVNTPHLNAAVEGTEFLVAMRCESTELSVFEGKVLAAGAGANIFPAQTISSGQILTIGGSEPPAVKLLVKPADAVQWVLYYPPLSDATAEAELPPAEQCRTLPKPLDQTCLTQRAEVLLRLGRVDEAQREVDEAVALDPGSGDANALRAIISIARNDKAGAIEAATAATTTSPNSPRAWLALSYAQQASFNLDASLVSARKAQSLEPNSSVTNARVAELLMSLGRIKDAEEAARAAVDANPSESRAHTVLGFVHLAQIKTKAARADFEAAIERDSSDPLPRLGLGLAIIRTGKLVEGREQLEIAVALDPTNSVLRSYVGKAYYEENTKQRDELAFTQFGLAKQLDPNDPTPWFYDAILNASQSRPAEALHQLDRSAELNDDRAVYRSRLLLDQDLAARTVSQAKTYNELGFSQLGLARSAESLAMDPASASAHRFLADIYVNLPRHEIARASELLQSQLRQPLGAPPLQPQLANDAIFKNAFFGPSSIGLSEFNPLFIRDRTELQLYGLYGDPRTYGDQVLVNGLYGPISFSASQFYLYDSGFRLNNDDTRRQYDAFAQVQITPDTSVQFEFTDTERESGDLQSAFDPNLFADNLRSDEKLDTYRLGLKQGLDARSDLLFSFIQQDRRAFLEFADPFFPVVVDSKQKSWKAELQYLTQHEHVDLLVGANYFRGESSEDVVTPFFSVTSDSKPDHTNAYSYLYFSSRHGLPSVQLGLAYDALKSDVGEQKELNPKIGLIWKPMRYLTLRGAAFRVLKRRINSDQGLEPTQLAGFNQFFDDPNGTVSEGGGVAVDAMLAPNLTTGLEVTRRRLLVPFFTPSLVFQLQTEDVVGGYLYWLANDRLSMSLQPSYQRYIQGALFDEMTLVEIPLVGRMFFPGGLLLGTAIRGVWQKGTFVGEGGTDFSDSDRFWLVDGMVAYRLPKRLGTISCEASNIFNKTFNFQEVDQTVAPRYIPMRRILLRASVAF